jgi:hypothetical protein
LVALLVGGGIALSSHGTKTATKLAANTSPEPISNMALGLASDVVSVGGTVLMAWQPIVMVGLVALAVVFSVLLVCWIFRLMRRMLKPQASAPAA